MKHTKNIFLIWLWIVFLCVFSTPLNASQKRCPVCDELFSDETKICPNDGTDLKLLGEPVKSPESDKTEKTKSQPVEKPKYKRQDRGTRKRQTQVEEPQVRQSNRTDRRRRIRNSRNSHVQDQGKRRFKKEDKKLKKQYKKNRNKKREDSRHYQTLLNQKNKPIPKKEDYIKGAPLLSIGARLSWMREHHSPGPVLGPEIDFNFIRETWRAGVSSYIGVRHVERNELLFIESISFGVQKPARYSPYFVARIGIGVIVSKRFGETLTNLIRNVGFEFGVDCRLQNTFVITPQIGYNRLSIEEARWNSVSLKFSLGF